MTPPSWIWIVFTLVAVAAQTLRNAMQRKLTGTVGTLGATEVRFFYGLPFAALFLAGVIAWRGWPPAPHAAFVPWLLAGSLTQIVATGLLLSAMRHEGFVVAIAYSKTEPVQVALFGLVLLGDPLTAGLIAAVVAATAGVMLLSWPGTRNGAGPLPVVQGLASAAFFAASSVTYRGAIEQLGGTSFIADATLTLTAGLLLQTIVMLAFSAWHDRRTLAALAAAWKPALLAGLLAAIASQFWFLAFALESAARVRTLGVVEVLFAQIVSLQMFREGLSWRRLAGVGLIGVAMVTVVPG
jgi:drug/metabolite transporter (DMT)-like permease